MIKKFLLLITVLVAIQGFAGQPKNKNSVSDVICSSTECYTILEELGEGAFGKVYAVEDSVGQHYAIKSYKTQKDSDFIGLLGDAKREYKRGRLLDHSNIVKTFDLFEVDSSPDDHITYLVLELVEGKTLLNVPRKSLSFNQALTSSLQFVDALRYALSQELLYLDLHDNNIMLANSSDIMIVDLASFFSFDEVFEFVTKEQEEEKPKAKKKKTVQKLIAHMNEKKCKKLKKFFLQHPKLFGKMKKENKENKKKKKGKIFKHAKEKEVELDQKQMMPMLSYYFNNMTEICIELIVKSDLSREEKSRLRTAIKMLAWDYLEDVEEDAALPIDHYLDKLIDILQS